MKKKLRKYFDDQMSEVIPLLPVEVQRIIETELPIQVEDYPSEEILNELMIDSPNDLCGLYTGIAMTDRSIEDAAPLPDQIILYRQGIIYAVLCDDSSLPDEFFDDLDENLDNLSIESINEAALDEQIRITILHELGHLYGLDEEALDELGYA